MPIIPRYNLTQSSTHVHIEVSIPHVRVSTSTLDLVIVDGTELHLYAPPTYLLKLTLPDRVVDEDAVEDSLAGAATVGSDIVRVVEDCDATRKDECIDDEVGTGPGTKLSSHDIIIWTKDDLPKLQYNPEKNHGTLVVTLRKEEEGIWRDLDLLGRLQEPAKQRQQAKAVPQETSRATSNPLVKVIDADGTEDGAEMNNDEKEAAASTEVMEDLMSINQKSPTYGLFQHFSNVFRDYAREGLAHEMLECPNPDEVFASSTGDNNDDCEAGNDLEQQNRREMRLGMENEKFDSDRYLNDLNIEEEGDMVFDAAMMMVPHWMEATNKIPDESIDNVTNQLSKLSTSDKQQAAFFTDEESHLLATLPPQSNRSTELTTEQKRSAFLSLTDILFAYAFDHRTTDGDPTVESSWTVMIMSPTLAWLENYNPPYDTVVDVVRWNIRRSLIYPYLRSYSLAKKVVEDVCLIFKRGRRTVIRCLLQLHCIMEKSESHYLFNKLYVDPLIVWIQRCEEEEVTGFGREMEGSLVHKSTKLSTATAMSNSDAAAGDAKRHDPLGKEHLVLGLAELEISFFEDDEKPSSASEDDDESYSDSDSDSSGSDDEIVSTSEKEEPLTYTQNQKTASSSPTDYELCHEHLPGSNRVDTNHSSALLDEYIGSTSGVENTTSESKPAGQKKKLIEEA